MDFSDVDQSSGKKFTGLIIVIILHVLVVWALVSGLARKVVEVIKSPIETKIIEEVKPPPPPPDTPPPPPPKMTAPPPPFIPPPEVSVQTPVNNNAISQTSSVAPPANQPFRPQAPAEAPKAVGPSRVPAVVDSKNCQKPEYPPKSLRNEETGTVTLQFLIGLDGKVVESKVEKTSGYRDLDIAARNALSLCKFVPGTVDGKPEQSWTRMQYVWKLE